MTINHSCNFQTPLSVSFNLDLFCTKMIQLVGFNDSTFEFTFVDDPFMSDLNQTYFNKPDSTDVITFNLGSQENPHADIYICVDDAARNASHSNQGLDDEIKLLITHSILHIKGYTDYNDEQKKVMFQEQDRLLRLVRDYVL